MLRRKLHLLLATLITASGLGCAHFGGCSSCNTCNTGCEVQSCNTCETACDPCGPNPWYRRSLFKSRSCGGCNTCSGGGLHNKFAYMFAGWRSNAIPDRLPLGSTVRAHYQIMQTNGEAADFILHRNDFVGDTAELTSDGKDKILEIAARMRSDPFPVLVERSENNCNPELDAFRRNIVAQILFDHGNPDADQRTIVSPAYGLGYNSQQAEGDYYRYLYSNGGGNGGNIGGGFGGGFGGGLGGGGLGR